MDRYEIVEVDASDPAIVDLLNAFNDLAPEIFPPLKARHFETGYWWIVYHGMLPVAFAGLVPMEPFGAGYCKRCFVAPDHVGHGLQLRLLFVREVKSRELGYTHLVSECAPDSHSIANFRRAGFERMTEEDIEQPWGKPGAIYWVKKL